MENYRIKYSIRIINVTKEFNDLFVNSCNSYDNKISPYFKNENNYVIVLPINEDFEIDKIKEFLESHGEGINYDIFISLSTNTDSLIAEIPSFVTNIIKNLSCKVNLSFTYIEA